MNPDAAPEFSVIVRPSALLAEGSVRDFDIEASAAQCKALAGRFGFVAIDYLRASMSIRPVRNSGDFRLTGHLSSRVTQSCVVTLEPVSADIEQDFELLLCPEDSDEGRLNELEDDIELFGGDTVDIGEIAAVELALSVDPYPKAPGAQGDLSGEESPETSENRPFDVLARLKRTE